MKLRCCRVDAGGRLWQVPVEFVRRVWQGRTSAPGDWDSASELRVLTMVCDRGLRPRLTYFLRLRLEHGWATDATRAEAVEAIEAGNVPDYSHPAVQRQLEGWPGELPSKLAVVLDVPAREVRANIGIGGPLQLADIHGLPVARFLEGYADAFEE